MKLNLNDVVSEINFFSLFSGSVFNIKYANEVSSPATQQAVEELKKYARKHSQLGKRVWQRKQNLSHLIK